MKYLVTLLIGLLLSGAFAQDVAISTSDLASYLTDSEGMSLYIFTKDEKNGSSACYDDCAVAWPPFIVEDAVDAEGIAGEFDLITRDDGALQVSYNDQPLYYWAGDSKPGDTLGHGVGDVWFVAEVKEVETAKPATKNTNY